MNGIILLDAFAFVVCVLCAYEAWHDKETNYKLLSIAFAIGAIGELVLLFLTYNHIKS